MAGETRVVRAVRRELRHERGIPSERYGLTGYWLTDAEDWTARYERHATELEALWAAGRGGGPRPRGDRGRLRGRRSSAPASKRFTRHVREEACLQGCGPGTTPCWSSTRSIAIAAVVVLVAALKLHAVPRPDDRRAVHGPGRGLGVDKLLDSYEGGVGDTLGSVGILLALGTMLGKLLAESGGADRIADTVLARCGHRRASRGRWR